MLPALEDSESSTRSNRPKPEPATTEKPGRADGSAARHFHGFDYARCVLALAVVALHTSAFGTSAYARAVYDHVLSLAVPSFFLISLFLFADKGQTGGRPAFSPHRAARAAVRLLVRPARRSYSVIPVRSLHALHSITGFVRLAVKGGNAVFYFFSCLALMTLVASMACRLAPRLLWLAGGVVDMRTVADVGTRRRKAVGGVRELLQSVEFRCPTRSSRRFWRHKSKGRIAAASSAVKASAVLGAVFLLFASVTLLEGRFLRTGGRPRARRLLAAVGSPGCGGRGAVGPYGAAAGAVVREAAVGLFVGDLLRPRIRKGGD